MAADSFMMNQELRYSAGEEDNDVCTPHCKGRKRTNNSSSCVGEYIWD